MNRRRPTAAQIERRWARENAKMERELLIVRIQFAIIAMADRMATTERHYAIARCAGQAEADKLEHACTRQRRALRRLIDALARLATGGGTR